MWQAAFWNARAAESRGPTRPAAVTSRGSGAMTTWPVRGSRYRRARYSVITNGFSTNSTCWTICQRESGRRPRASSAGNSYSTIRSTSYAVNGFRSCLACPGWPPADGLPRRLPASGLGGFTISLEGGLELFPEFFFKRATFASSWAIRACKGATASAKAALINLRTSSSVKRWAMPPS